MITALGHFGRPKDKMRLIGKRSEIESFDVQLSGCGKAPAEQRARAKARA